MVLNESKTKIMLVAGKRRHKKMSSTSLTVHVNSVELEQVQSHELLGVIIDTQLNFNEHIDNLCKKLTQRIAVLKKYQISFTFRSRNSLLQCHDKETMMYGSSVWVLHPLIIEIRSSGYRSGPHKLFSMLILEQIV